MRWHPNRKPPGTILFIIINGGYTHHNFTILFSYWFSITTIKNAIVTNQKQTKLRIHSYCIFFNENWGRFSNREKRLEIQKYIFEIHLKYIEHTFPAILNSFERFHWSHDVPWLPYIQEMGDSMVRAFHRMVRKGRCDHGELTPMFVGICWDMGPL